MTEIVKDFAEYVQSIHGDLWMLLFRDNLKSYLYPEVKECLMKKKF